MMTTVLILSKTHMNNGSCVGGITFEGRYVRLLDENGNNQPVNTDFSPKQVWNIEFKEPANTTAPHIEDIIVLNKQQKETLNNKILIKDFLLEKEITIWRGNPNELFDRLIRFTPNGSGYIDKNGIPKHSVGFWICDKDLKKQIEFSKAYFYYSNPNNIRKIKYKGFEEPVDIIPTGTLIRVSLARWKSFNENEEPKCWLQLSGWYDLGR